MDLSKLKPSKAETGAVLNLVHPATNDPLPMSITMLGLDSAKHRAMTLKKTQENLDLIGKGRKAAALDAKRLDNEERSNLAQLTVAWSGIELNGEALECTPENAERVYSEFPWVHEQVAAFVRDRANFF